MKIAHRFVSIVAVGLLLATGAAMLWNRFPRVVAVPAAAQPFFAAAHRSGRLGALFLAVGLAWLATFIGSRRRSQFIAFENSGGEVRVSVSAIADYLTRIAGEFPWLVSVKPVVAIQNHRVLVDLRCRVKAGRPLPELSRGLQDRVRDSLAKTLGLAEIEKVSVTVRGILGDAGPLAASDAAPERALPAIYGGSEPMPRESANESSDRHPDQRRRSL